MSSPRSQDPKASFRLPSRRLVFGSALLLALSCAGPLHLRTHGVPAFLPSRSALVQMVDDHPWLLLPLVVFHAVSR